MKSRHYCTCDKKYYSIIIGKLIKVWKYVFAKLWQIFIIGKMQLFKCMSDTIQLCEEISEAQNFIISNMLAAGKYWLITSQSTNSWNN